MNPGVESNSRERPRRFTKNLKWLKELLATSINLPNRQFTFETSRERNNIDLILSTPDLIDSTTNWEVLNQVVITDHKVCSVKIQPRSEPSED